MGNCWSCSQDLQPNWANCPFCGAEGVNQNQCPQCEKHVENSWEFCPNCGYTKGSGKPSEISATNVQDRGVTRPVAQSTAATQPTAPMKTQPYTSASTQTINSQDWQKFDADPDAGETWASRIGFGILTLFFLVIIRIILRAIFVW